MLKLKNEPVDPMAAVYAARRANLAVLVAQHKGQDALAAKLGLSGNSYISQLLSETRPKTMSEKVARGIETKLGIASGWMDTARHGGAS